MAETCLHCGTPLGTATTRCHTCQSDGVDLETVVDVDDDVLDRVEADWPQSVAAVRAHVLSRRS